MLIGRLTALHTDAGSGIEEGRQYVPPHLPCRISTPLFVVANGAERIAPPRVISCIKEGYLMTSELLTEGQAAAFCQLALSYFKNLRRTGRAPTFLRPSPRVTMYRTSDLEAWRASWTTVETKKGKVSNPDFRGITR